MSDITKPSNFLAELRKLASQITDAADEGKFFDAAMAVKALKMFQDLDQALCEGGDAPDQWTADEE